MASTYRFMAEGVSSNTILRSYQASLKRCRDEDSDSGGATELSRRCGYLGCRRPGRPVRGEGTLQFCSASHKDYCMADLFDKLQRGGSHGTEQPREVCKLHGCDSGLWVIDSSTGEAYDFCRKKHALEYKQHFTELWDLEGRRCQFEKCGHHVRVDETRKKVYEYCGDDHEFEAAGKRGILAAAAKRQQTTSANAVSWLPRPVGHVESDGEKDPGGTGELWKCIPQETSRQDVLAKIEHECGYHKKAPNEAIENCIKHLLLHFGDFKNADPGGNFCIGTNITQSDPWKVVKGLTGRYFMHYIDSEPGRQRTTSRGFGWKQTSSSHKNKRTNAHIETTYFFYEWRGKDEDNDHSDEPEGVWEGAYRQYDNDKKAGKLKTTEKTWRMHQFSPSPEFVKQVTQGQFQSKIPVITKIFQNKSGLPVCPSLAHREETQSLEVAAKENFAPVHMRTMLEAPLLVEESGLTSSSISSNGSSEGLPPEAVSFPTGQDKSHGGKTVQGSNTNETEVSFDFACLQDTGVEVIEYQSKAPIYMGSMAVATSLVREGGMTSSISSNASSEGLLPQGESLQGSNSNETEGSHRFFPKALSSQFWDSLTEDNHSCDAALYQNNVENDFQCDWLNGFARM